MNRQLLAECLTHLQGALKVSALYPEGHPGIQNPLQNVTRGLSTLLEAGHPLVLGIVDDVLAFDEIPFYETDTVWRTLFSALRGRGIESITFQSGIEPNDILGILHILKSTDSGETADLATLWKRHEIRHASYCDTLLGDDVRVSARRTYEESLGLVVEMMTELRMGRIPSTRSAIEVVDGMGDIILQDPNALLGMAMLKSYDQYTYNHSVNVSIFCLALGRHLELERDELLTFGLAGLLHDVGKVRTNESIIKKSGMLDDEELRLIKLHPELGAEILDSMQGVDPAARAMVLQHHVRFDRTGYPERLASAEIHPLAEGVGLADCYDALTTTRAYQRSHHPSDAARIIQRCAGAAFRPELAEQFIAMLGTYPVGEAVRLATGEVAVVTAKNPLDATSPVVRIVLDIDGNLLEETRRVELADPSEARRRIVASVNSLAKGIDVATILQVDLKD